MYFEVSRCIQVGAILFFVFCVLMAHPSSIDHLAKGDEYYRSFDNEHALAEYQLAYSNHECRYETLLRLVRLHNDMGVIALYKDKAASEGQYRTALAYADTLKREYPDSTAADFWYALAKGSLIPFVGVREKIQIGKEVRQSLREAIQRDSTFAFPYIVLAIFERESARLSWIEKGFVRIIFGEDISGSLQTSEQCLLKALSNDPGNAFAYYELYWTYKAMGDTQRGIDALKHVTAIVPHNLREKDQQEKSQEILNALLAQNR
jgi:tetratricopeptide (TPR) repeat protein